MILKPSIFRAYDIRGEAFIDFDEDGFFVIASAFGQYISQKFKKENPKVFVSGDARNSMPELYPSIIDGLKASGCDVLWGGALPTPMNYFRFHEGDFDAAIQISASHNPPQDNGLKLTDREGAVCGEEIQKIKKLAECEKCNLTSFGECKNNCSPKESSEKYLRKLKSIVSPQKPQKIIVDCGNAIPGIFYPEFLEAFGHQITRLYCDLDARFPHHQPDPERPENLKDLQEKMSESSYDFGFAFDGDGDRIGIILGDGTILNADKIMYALASDFLSRHPGASIVLDAMTSATLIEKIKSLGGVPVLSKTGHSYIEETMKKHQSLLGGEQSGHFMFGEDFYGHDDAMLAGLRFLQALENRPEILPQITSHWPELVEFSEKIKVEDEKKFEILDQIIPQIKKDYPHAQTIDGIRIDWGEGEWAIIRCSNTSPKIAVRMEMKNQERIQQMKPYFLGMIENLLK